MAEETEYLYRDAVSRKNQAFGRYRNPDVINFLDPFSSLCSTCRVPSLPNSATI